MECSPLCGISWLLGEDEEPLVGESELYKIEETIVEQSEDQFSYIESVLTFQHADDNITQFPISCRYDINIVVDMHQYSCRYAPINDFLSKGKFSPMACVTQGKPRLSCGTDGA